MTSEPASLPPITIEPADQAPGDHNERRRRATTLLGWLLHHAVSIAMAALFLLPLLWMFAASLRLPGLPPPRTIEWIPEPVAWRNYPRIFAMLPFGRYTLNSLFVVALAVPITLLVASWAGFAIAQLERRTRDRLVVLSVGLLMVPITALWLTRFVLFKWLGLINTHWALIAPAIMGSSPLFVLLFYWTFRRVPGELFESARLDGAGAFSIWRYIAMPLARPTILAVAVLTFLLYWGDFINPLLYLKSLDLYTLPVGVRQLQQLDKTNWPLLMAASVVMAFPSILMFLLVQRYFLQESRLAGMYGR
ncbi:MAG: carbohydrate ABC transporter permease [Ardenticatenaceae bacterium]